MPRLRKEETDDLDIKALEDAEYSSDQYASYGGEIPPNDTILRAYVKSIWWARTQAGDAMLKVLTVAGENEGELAEYDGLPCWENMSLTTSAKFKWAPFLEHFGLTIRDIKKISVADDDDNVGAPVEKIASFVPGSDESWCRIITSREKYNGDWQAHVGAWLPYDDDEGDEPEETEEVDDDDPADSWEEDEDSQEAQEPDIEVPPARSRRQPARTAAKASKPSAPTPTRSAGRKPVEAVSGPARARSARAATPAATPVPSRGRRRAAQPAEDNEPPF